MIRTVSIVFLLLTLCKIATAQSWRAAGRNRKMPVSVGRQ